KRVRIEEKDMIYSVRLDGAPCDLAQDKRQVPLLHHLGVVRGLVVESYIAGFAGKSGRTVVDVRPLKVLSSEQHHDFIGQAASGEHIPPWLVVRLAHAIEARVFEFEGQQPFLGLVFDHHSYRRIARPCSEWLKDGFDLTGLYVSEQVPFNDTRIQPRLRLVGSVSKVEGTTLHLT
ncbi:MAG TPA: hypothetical protein DCE44_25250, partial [Verrucomicrobiales bacterium]|nr:hypothetical protein [Verrucomicrobiales bacterium]